MLKECELCHEKVDKSLLKIVSCPVAINNGYFNSFDYTIYLKICDKCYKKKYSK